MWIPLTGIGESTVLQCDYTQNRSFYNTQFTETASRLNPLLTI